jgi:hypothetical protein
MSAVDPGVARSGPKRNVVLLEIEGHAAKGLTAPQIAALTGRDLGYVEYRVALYRISQTVTADPWRINPEKDAAFVDAIQAEGKRLGLRGFL